MEWEVPSCQRRVIRECRASEDGCHSDVGIGITHLMAGITVEGEVVNWV